MVSWEQEQEFFEPIVLQGRTPLLTLRDAAHYITKLPKAEHDAEERQAAMQALSGCRTWRANDVRTDRRDAGSKPARRARVRYVAQRRALGDAEIKEGSMTDGRHLLVIVAW
jgi:hypothetical protein